MNLIIFLYFNWTANMSDICLKYSHAQEVLNNYLSFSLDKLYSERQQVLQVKTTARKLEVED